MPQQFHAVRCCDCGTFQVQQVKKIARFSCSLCGKKQSVQRAYAHSDKAKDCRLHVQQLNLKRQAAEQYENEASVQEQQPPVTAHSAINWRTYEDEVGPVPDHEVEKEEEAGFTTLPEQAARKKARVHGLSGTQPCLRVDQQPSAARRQAFKWADFAEGDGLA